MNTVTIELTYKELDTVISGLYRLIDLEDIGATSAEDYGAALHLLNKLTNEVRR